MVGQTDKAVVQAGFQFRILVEIEILHHFAVEGGFVVLLVQHQFGRVPFTLFLVGDAFGRNHLVDGTGRGGLQVRREEADEGEGNRSSGGPLNSGTNLF